MKVALKIWWIFLAGALIYATATAMRAGIPGMVFDQIRQELGFTAAQTAGIASWRTAGCILFAAIAGFLIDRLGWRKLLLAGAVMQLTGDLMAACGNGPWMFYCGAFINGSGMTITYLSLLKLLDAEFASRYFALLIGIFYLFSYGGNFCGTAPFAGLLAYASWQEILLGSSGLTLLLTAVLGLLFLTGPRSAAGVPPPRTVRQIPWRELAHQLKKPPCMAIFLVTASSLGIYWSMVMGTAGKYLTDIGGGSGPLAAMNLIVTVEMIFGGTLCFLCGNRRKWFQTAGALLNALGIALLFAGTFADGHAAVVCAWAAMPALGAGYGFTCINITAVREYIPPALAATAIGLVNLGGNILLILLNQCSGIIFDLFRAPAGLAATPAGYRLLLICYGIPALAAIPAALRLRETRGRNISAKL